MVSDALRCVKMQLREMYAESTENAPAKYNYTNY